MHIRTRDDLHKGMAALALGTTGLFAIWSGIPEADGQTNSTKDSKAGFVVHEWGNAGARGPTACPNGRSLGYRQIFEKSPEGQRREGESDADYDNRLQAGGFKMATFEGK